MRNRTFKKALVVLMAMAMVLAMTVTSFAASGTGYEVVGSATTYSDPIQVKVVIQSKRYNSSSTSEAINDVYTVTLGQASTAGQTFTVRDAMVALSDDSSNGIKAYDANGNTITSSSTYIKSIGKTTDGTEKVYSPALPVAGYELDGWCFRLNGKIPLESLNGDPTSGGPYGTTIVTTPIKDGDVIHFYWDYPYQKTATKLYSANFLTADMSYTDGSLNIQLMKSDEYFDNSSYWHISDFVNYSHAYTGSYNVTICDAAGNTVKTGTICQDGTGTITDCGLESGKTYYVRVDSTSYKKESPWYILNETMAFEKIVA